MGLLFFSTVFGIQTGIESMFIKDPGGPETVVPGRPSIPAMINFLLITLAAILNILNPEKLVPKLRIIGYIVAATGLLAVVGYVLHVPALTYYIRDVNTPMAINTAVLFVLLGSGFVCL
jgi:hypothetical protein